MNPSNPLPFRTFFLAALAGILSFLPHFSANAEIIESPAGDLTVTVEEQENGDVKFTLSGTAFMQASHSGISSTNFSNSTFPGVPPTYSFGSFGLPAGLTLSTPDNQSSGSEDPEEGGTAPLIDHPLNWIYFSGGWQLSGPFTTGPLYQGDPISGSGSVTTNMIPFGPYFVPGTYLVEPGGFLPPPSEPEVAEGASTNQGVYPYFITYHVIPFTYNPSISLSGPGAFSKTLVRKSGGSQKVKITNSGNASLTNLDLSISGPGSRDFSSTGLSANELAPGESTTVEVSFRPKRKGTRKATLTVKGSYIPRMPLGVTSEPEEIPLEDLIESPPVPVEISASTELSGKGIAKPRNKPRPNSPRFPRAR